PPVVPTPSAAWGIGTGRSVRLPGYRGNAGLQSIVVAASDTGGLGREAYGDACSPRTGGESPPALKSDHHKCVLARRRDGNAATQSGCLRNTHRGRVGLRVAMRNKRSTYEGAFMFAPATSQLMGSVTASLRKRP